VRVVERAADRVEVGEQQVAVDEPVDGLAARALLQAAQRLARAREQVAPAARRIAATVACAPSRSGPAAR
jgi:hypothetical protein